MKGTLDGRVRRTARIVSAALLALGGAVPASGWAAEPAEQAPAAERRGEAEAAVRHAIAELFDVEPSGIDMQQPLSGEPLGLDDLDFVELVIEIEDRLGVVIEDEEIEALVGAPLDDSWTRVTPAMLVEAAGRTAR